MFSTLVSILILCLLCESTHVMGESSQLPESGLMKGWQICDYSGIDGFRFSENISMPKIQSDTDVLIEVYATSVNPLDQLMTGGYGRTALNTLRWINGIKEFPLILGRDFSGVVRAIGKSVQNLKIGDKVYGVVPAHRPGSIAEYVVVDQKTITLKPNNIDDVGAAGILFVGLTAWSSLYITGGIKNAETSSRKRICILGASGGVGTLAVQMMKAEGMIVTATCSTDSIQLVKDLGADRVIDYKTENVGEAVRGQKYDIIFDAAGQGADYAKQLPWEFDQYITLLPPLLNDTDSYGLIFGSIKSAWTLLTSRFTRSVKYGFFTSDPEGIELLTRLVQTGKMRPIIDSVYEFSAAREAFEKVAKGHLRGKVIIKIK